METEVVAAGDRRQSRRLESVDQHRIVSTRVRPGHRARIVDVSAAGALVETDYRLLPGAPIELQMQTATRDARVRGRVLRSAVAKLHASSICYRGAIRFDHQLPWFGSDCGGAVSSHEMRPASPDRAGATREVV